MKQFFAMTLSALIGAGMVASWITLNKQWPTKPRPLHQIAPTTYKPFTESLNMKSYDAKLKAWGLFVYEAVANVRTAAEAEQVADAIVLEYPSPDDFLAEDERISGWLKEIGNE